MIPDLEINNASQTGLLIGSSTQIRAAMCHAAQAQNLHLEPVAHLAELANVVLTKTNFIIAWNDFGLIKDLRWRMRQAGAWLPIIACDHQLTSSEIVDAIEAGAIDILEWPGCKESLSETVRSILARRSTHVSNAERARRAICRLDRLSARERQVLALVAEGYSSKDIAIQLGISPRTVEIHRMNALLHLGVKSTASAVGLVFEASFAEDLEEQTGFWNLDAMRGLRLAG